MQQHVSYFCPHIKHIRAKIAKNRVVALAQLKFYVVALAQLKFYVVALAQPMFYSPKNGK